jgi:formamidopyrimidine-DNA glycosylase
MPELPEVETVCRALNGIVSGKTILSAKLLRERLVPDCLPRDFSRRLANAKINSVHRIGKHILFDLSNGRTLITHLRMSGRFLHLQEDSDDPKFAHAIFHLDGNTRLVFDDQRHFGMMKVIDTSAVNETRSIKSLAPDPFSEAFSTDYLRSTLRSTKRSLKEFLIDQTKVNGLGNIYAAEVMFLAKLNPLQPADTISEAKSRLLHQMIRDVLQEAIDLGRSAEIDEANISGSIYGVAAPAEWRVYDREGLECFRCRRPIRRITQGGRSTYYCKSCQRTSAVKRSK